MLPLKWSKDCDKDGDALLRHVVVCWRHTTGSYDGSILSLSILLKFKWRLANDLLDCFHEWKVYRKRHFSQIFSSSVHLTQERNFGEKFCPNAAGLRTTLPHSTWNIGRLITQTRSFFFQEFFVRLIIDSKG